MIFLVEKKRAVACRTVYSSGIVKSDIYYCFVTFKSVALQEISKQ